MNIDIGIEKESLLIMNHQGNEKLQTVEGIDMKALLGVPHLFGRYYETREGFMIVPLGNMTLHASGRVTGYSNPNEDSWIPYEHGTVSSDKAFAFITKHNTWIPSSTWQQTLAGMPIGFFCDEPEKPQKLCLIPNTAAKQNKQIIYLVASCLRFYKQTIPKLLEELFAEGIEPERIKVVVNGCDEDDDRTINGVSYAFSRHNAWEWSALYEAPLRWTFDYAMLIHDTNQIFPGFRRKVETFNQYLNWDHLPATPLARCLLGLYSYSFLGRTNSWLKKTDGIDKRNGILAEVAGELLLRAKTALVMGDMEMNGAARQSEWREVADVFNTGTLRVRRVFPTINLHKFLHTGTTSAEHL